ncbi:MAG TPA: MFS transporter [Patescibacteria group bacterium]|nr:MFS transporter [Patescibacteria group bacterium]
MEPTENKKPISRNVVIMGLVSLFNDIASEMIYPIVPLFLNVVLGAPATIIGVIEGIAESMASILKVISGWFSDKIRRRKLFVTAGYSLSTISKLLIGLAQTWGFVLFARVIDRIGKGTRTSARDALILESVDPAYRGRAFGLHRSMDSLGAVFGPLLALLLIHLYSSNYRMIFYIAFIPSLVGVILLVLFVKEKRKSAEELGIAKPKDEKPFRFNWKEMDPRFKMFLLVSMLFALGNSSDAFLILRAKDLGLAVTLTVMAYVTFNITYFLFSYPAGWLSDKIGARKVMMIGFWLFALVYLFFGLTGSSFWVWFLFPIYGIYMALTDGISKAYISELVPKEKSATAIGAYLTATGLIMFVASTLAGFLWKYVSPSAPFYLGAATATIAAILFMTLLRNKKYAL